MGLEGIKPPASYEALFAEASDNGKTVTGKAARAILMKSKLKTEVLQNIWKLCDRHKKGVLNEQGFYSALALTSLAVNGKRINQYLMADLKAYPPLSIDATEKPEYVPDGLTDERYTYETLVRMENVAIGKPTQHGTLMKYYLFPIEFKKREFNIERRYSDFELLRNILCARYPFRIIPQLPPKKTGFNDQFLDERRLGLEQFLNYMGRHPILSKDEVVNTWVEVPVDKVASTMKQKYGDTPEEFSLFPDRVELAEVRRAEMSSDNHAVETKVNKVIVMATSLLKLTREHVTVKKTEARNYKAYSDTLKILAIDLPGEPLPCQEPKELEDLLNELADELELLSGLSRVESKRVFDESNTLLTGFTGLCEAYIECFARRNVLLQQKQDHFRRSHNLHRAALKPDASGDVSGKMVDNRVEEKLLDSRRRFADYCIHRESLWFQANCSELIEAVRQRTAITVASLKEQLGHFEHMTGILDRLETVKF